MVKKHDKDIAVLYEYLKKLLEPPNSPKQQIGYIHHLRTTLTLSPSISLK